MDAARLLSFSALVLVMLCGHVAHAQSVLDRVRTDNILRCGAAPGGGFAEVGPDGRLIGLAVEFCRALAGALLGPSSRVAFQLYDPDHALDGLRAGRDDVGFADEAAAPDIGIVRAGMVFDDAVAVMVRAGSPINAPADLVNRRVCIMIGSAGQRALDAFDARLGLHVARLAFEEDVEMLDAYNAQRCDAAVTEVSRLPEMSPRQSCLLPMALAHGRVDAAVKAGDTRWYDVVHGFVGGFSGVSSVKVGPCVAPQ